MPLVTVRAGSTDASTFGSFSNFSQELTETITLPANTKVAMKKASLLIDSESFLLNETNRHIAVVYNNPLPMNVPPLGYRELVNDPSYAGFTRELTLTPGYYTGAELAAHIQDVLNADAVANVNGTAFAPKNKFRWTVSYEVDRNKAKHPLNPPGPGNPLEKPVRHFNIALNWDPTTTKVINEPPNQFVLAASTDMLRRAQNPKEYIMDSNSSRIVQSTLRISASSGSPGELSVLTPSRTPAGFYPNESAKNVLGTTSTGQFTRVTDIKALLDNPKVTRVAFNGHHYDEPLPWPGVPMTTDAQGNVIPDITVTNRMGFDAKFPCRYHDSLTTTDPQTMAIGNMMTVELIHRDLVEEVVQHTGNSDTPLVSIKYGLDTTSAFDKNVGSPWQGNGVTVLGGLNITYVPTPATNWQASSPQWEGCLATATAVGLSGPVQGTIPWANLAADMLARGPVSSQPYTEADAATRFGTRGGYSSAVHSHADSTTVSFSTMSVWWEVFYDGPSSGWVAELLAAYDFSNLANASPAAPHLTYAHTGSVSLVTITNIDPFGTMPFFTRVCWSPTFGPAMDPTHTTYHFSTGSVPGGIKAIDSMSGDQFKISTKVSEGLIASNTTLSIDDSDPDYYEEVEDLTGSGAGGHLPITVGVPLTGRSGLLGAGLSKITYVGNSTQNRVDVSHIPDGDEFVLEIGSDDFRRMSVPYENLLLHESYGYSAELSDITDSSKAAALTSAVSLPIRLRHGDQSVFQDPLRTHSAEALHETLSPHITTDLEVLGLQDGETPKLSHLSTRLGVHKDADHTLHRNNHAIRVVLVKQEGSSFVDIAIPTINPADSGFMWQDGGITDDDAEGLLPAHTPTDSFRLGWARTLPVPFPAANVPLLAGPVPVFTGSMAPTTQGRRLRHGYRPLLEAEDVDVLNYEVGNLVRFGLNASYAGTLLYLDRLYTTLGYYTPKEDKTVPYLHFKSSGDNVTSDAIPQTWTWGVDGLGVALANLPVRSFINGLASRVVGVLPFDQTALHEETIQVVRGQERIVRRVTFEPQDPMYVALVANDETFLRHIDVHLTDMEGKLLGGEIDPVVMLNLVFDFKAEAFDHAELGQSRPGPKRAKR